MDNLDNEELQNMAAEIHASANAASNALDDLAHTASGIAGIEVKVETKDVEKSLLSKIGSVVSAGAKALGGAAADSAEALGEYYKTVGEGREKFSDLSIVMKGATKALDRIPYAGEAVAGVLKAIGPIGDELLKELDMQRAMYHDLSKYGALTGQGLTNLQDVWLKSQMSSKEFSAAVHRSSADFALLGGTTAEGLNKYSDVMGEMLQGSDQRLRLLGLQQPDIARATESYIRIQNSLGLAQKKSARDIEAGARDYTIQLSTLSKFTGRQIEEIEKELEKAHETDRYEALMLMLPKEQKAVFQRRRAELAKAGPEAQKGFTDLVAGVVTDASIKFRNTYGAAMSDFEKSDSQAIAESQEYAKNKKNAMALMYAKNEEGAKAMFGPLHESVKWTQGGVDALAAAQEDTAAAMKGLDKQTKSSTKAEQATESLYNKTHKTLTAGLPVIADVAEMATTGLNDLSEEAMDLAKKFSEVTGITPEKLYKGFKEGMNAVKESLGFGGKGPGEAFSAEVEGAIKKASESTGVDLGYMRTMAKIESGGRAGAANVSGAKGLYQFMPGTAAEYGIAGKEFDPEASAKAAAQYTQQNAEALKKAGIEPTPELLYLAHQQGAGGAIQLVKAAQEGKEYGQLSPKLQRNMAANRGAGKSPAEFIDMWKTQYAKAAGETPALTKTEEPQKKTEVAATGPETPTPEVTPAKPKKSTEKKQKEVAPQELPTNLATNDAEERLQSNYEAALEEAKATAVMPQMPVEQMPDLQGSLDAKSMQDLGMTPFNGGTSNQSNASTGSFFDNIPLLADVKEMVSAITSNNSVPIFTQDQINQELSSTLSSTLDTQMASLNEQAKSDLTAPKLAETGIAAAPTPASGLASPNDSSSQTDPNVAIAEMNSILVDIIGKLDLINMSGQKQIVATAQLEKAVQTP